MQKNCCSCPVEFVADPFGESSFLADLIGTRRFMIVADVNVVQRVEGIGTRIGKYVQERSLSLAGAPVVIAGGEKAKDAGQKNFDRLVTAMLEAKLGRDDFVLAIGGGTVLDVAGYAAAQVRGGIGLVRMPTTPAAMLDAAFAKTAAIDFGGVKDSLRVASEPAAVVIDPAFAATVLDGVWNGGIGEAVRLAAVRDGALAKKLVKYAGGYRARDAAVLADLVEAVHAVRAKKGATGFGLWAAERLETMSDFRLPHGYSVAIGVVIDSAYAVAKGHMKAADRDTLVGMLKDCGALDGLRHSRHLFGQTESLLCGIDAWRLARGAEPFEFPGALGKCVQESDVDREVMAGVIKSLVSASTDA